MRADVTRRMARGLAAAAFAVSIAAGGPAPSQARADGPDWLNPCNAPGGKYVCDKAKEGAKWLYDNSGADSVVEGVGEAVDFASDPFGHIEQKLREGTKGLFKAFGEELTGKDPDSPKKERKPEKDEEG
ncbi:hypothetical protein AB0B04_19465 [Streptomyces xinghaiensis]|uniref:Uncharacterized protein n=2 Tax=Streptomyces TaxID=1883 RepID=A0A3R7LL04_9ACTN|nr:MULTISPECIES: hypothetical protein [Streptomyces]KNE83360.1 hypothetical protein ADZ36_05945 [Streptomyces fradiae]OFA37033.1 hypothetical protein BEN35_29370 [Streptomyces fradiae]PQM20551.1 hypothetical protein Sfr7A_25465 [Streptomyces xinghaiensis]RKM92493.1 hypothetical protein SFRA_024120 [Streptomyces xinghaiensis]RNC70460.1 hypothetical protein DC095_025110 [Streptomyces xinghaiensis]